MFVILCVAYHFFTSKMNTLSKVIASRVEGLVAYRRLQQYRHTKFSFILLHRVIERVLQGGSRTCGQYLRITGLDDREFDSTQEQKILLSFKTFSPTLVQYIGVDISPRVTWFGVRLTAVFHLMPIFRMSGVYLHLHYIP